MLNKLKMLAGAVNWPQVSIDVGGFVGAGLLAYGAWAVYHPAGYIVGGALLLGGRILIARNS